MDSALEVGALSETVQVTGQAALLQTDTSRVASLVSERTVQDAPIQGRNIMNFIQLTPGASEGNANATTSGNRPDDRRQTSAVSIMGAAENDNSQLIDGMDNTERVQAGMGIKPSIDAIAEVLVQTNNYSAENGRTLAGVINIITKSGGNRFSGSAFEFTRHEAFDAKNFFATSNDTPLNRLHQFGGSLGGPIKTNQTFFFVDYDQNRIRKGVTSVVTVPTMKMRSGDFSEVPAVIYDPLTIPRLPFPGNQIPANRIEPLAAKLFALYPAPTSPGLANNFAMENESWQTNHTTDVRVDHRFNNTDSIFARYSYNTTTGLTPSMCPVADFQGRKIDPTCNTQGTQGIYSGPYPSYAHNAIASWVHIYNPTLVSEVKFNYVRPLTTAERPEANDADLGQFLGFQNINYPDDPITGGMPWFEPRPLSYAAIGDPTFIPMTTENHNYQFAGSVTKTLRAHSFKDRRRARLPAVRRAAVAVAAQHVRVRRCPDEELGWGGRRHMGIVAARLSQSDSAHPLPDSPREPYFRTEYVRTGRLASHVVAHHQPWPSLRGFHAHDGSRGSYVGLQSGGEQDPRRRTGYDANGRCQHRLQRYRAARRVCGDAAEQDGPAKWLRHDV